MQEELRTQNQLYIYTIEAKKFMKWKKNYYKIEDSEKTHTYFKTPVNLNFQKNRRKTVGGFVPTRYLLSIHLHSIRAQKHWSKTKSGFHKKHMQTSDFHLDWPKSVGGDAFIRYLTLIHFHSTEA